MHSFVYAPHTYYRVLTVCQEMKSFLGVEKGQHAHSLGVQRSAERKKRKDITTVHCAKGSMGVQQLV